MAATIALLMEFEQQYSVGTADITAKIGQLGQIVPSERTSAINEIRRLLSDMEDLLEQMELSVRELNSNRYPDTSIAISSLISPFPVLTAPSMKTM